MVGGWEKLASDIIKSRHEVRAGLTRSAAAASVTETVTPVTL